MHLQQLKGIQRSKQGTWNGYCLPIEGIRKGYLFREKLRAKGLDLGTEPPRINIWWVPPPFSHSAEYLPFNGRLSAKESNASFETTIPIVFAAWHVYLPKWCFLTEAICSSERILSLPWYVLAFLSVTSNPSLSQIIEGAGSPSTAHVNTTWSPGEAVRFSGCRYIEGPISEVF